MFCEHAVCVLNDELDVDRRGFSGRIRIASEEAAHRVVEGGDGGSDGEIQGRKTVDDLVVG